MTRTRHFGNKAVLLALLLFCSGRGLSAQDCSSAGADELNDIRWVRSCVPGSSPDRWLTGDGGTLLHTAAAFTRNPTVISIILDAGFDPNARNDPGATPLHVSAGNNDNPVVTSLLLDAGANPYTKVNNGHTPLHSAIRYEETVPAVVSILLEAGADPNTRDNDGDTPLHLAIRYEKKVRAVVSILLEAGADPRIRNYDGDTPLHTPYMEYWQVSALLDAGADPNIKNYDGETPLHFPTKREPEVALVSMLLDAGADPNARDSGGMTPLDHLVLRYGVLAAVEALLAAGAEPGRAEAQKDEDGHTPLHHAAMAANSATIAVLVAAGANVDVRDLEGNKPIDYLSSNTRIRESQKDAVARLLGGGIGGGAARGAAGPAREEPRPVTPAAAGLPGDLGAKPGMLLRDCAGCPETLEASHDPGRLTGTKREKFVWLRQFSGAPDPDRTGSGTGPGPLFAAIVQSNRRLTTLTGLSPLHQAIVSFNGSLSSFPDAVWDDGPHYDVWSVTARAGQRLVIDMDSEDVDAYLVVLRDDGNEVPRDDDGGGDLNARVEFEVPATGRYTILAASLFSETTGRYTIRVERPTDSEETPTTDDLSRRDRSVP